MRALSVGAVIACASLLLLTGCAAETTVTPPDAAPTMTFDQAREEATSAFESDALADDRITREEYEQAVALYMECLTDAGLDATAEQQATGLYQYAIRYEEGTTQADPAEYSCALGTTYLVEPLYGQSIADESGG